MLEYVDFQSLATLEATGVFRIDRFPLLQLGAQFAICTGGRLIEMFDLD